MKKKIPRNINAEIVDLQKILNPTLAMLDLQGTDETVTKALTIVNQAFVSITSKEDVNPEKLYSRAMQIYEQQKNTENQPVSSICQLRKGILAT